MRVAVTIAMALPAHINTHIYTHFYNIDIEKSVIRNFSIKFHACVLLSLSVLTNV